MNRPPFVKTERSAISRVRLATSVMLLAVWPAAAARCADECFLTKNGQPVAAIVIGQQPSAFDRWVAGELQRYVEQLSGAELPVVMAEQLPAQIPLVIVGGPHANPLAAEAQNQQLVDFEGLKPDGFILKTVSLAGRPALLAGGNDPAGTMYAVYELLERLGIVFQLTNDIIPARQPDLALPSLDLRLEPLLKYRGMHCCHGLRWYMGLREFRQHIDQLAKLKMNCLQFYVGMGSPWVEFSYAGKTAEILYPKESGFVAWGFALSTSGTAKDVRVGRECFSGEYLGPPEFGQVQTPEEAYRTARDFLHEIIRYAHQRQVQVWLVLGEIPYVPPNLAPAGTKSLHNMYCGVGIPPGDPTLLGVWQAALRSAIENYPEADGYGVWTSELFLDADDPQTQLLLRANDAVRRQIPSLDEIHRGGYVTPDRPEHLASDLAQICVASKLIESVKQDYPQAKLGVAVLFRSYLFRALDSVLPKDVWLMSMETWANSAPVMHYYGDVRGRELLVMPRIDDDGSELHMQLNAMLYDRDEIIAGSARHGLAGIVGQLNKERGLECNARYVAEGAWDAQIQCRPFYQRYLGRIYGPQARDALVQAYLRLEENDQALGWHGRHGIFIGYARFAPCRLRKSVDLKHAKPDINPEEFQREVTDATAAREFWRGRLSQCRAALELLHQARAQVEPGAKAELEYVTFKTENLITYFQTLDACDEGRAAWAEAVLAKRNEDDAAVLVHLEACQAALDRADRLATTAARQMTAHCSIPTEKYLLFRFNQNVIDSIETNRAHVTDAVTFYQAKR